MASYIDIIGARTNNLKNINVRIPRDKLVVITGLSGSGKSSLAFDTIYAEGHRRFVESLSSYARMFLGHKPDVDSIEGLSPAISIDQKTTSKNPRSTVGTVTEIYDYLRLLYARLGTPHCPVCGKPIKRQTTDQIIDRIMALPERTKFIILAPVVRSKKGQHEKIFEQARKSGFVRARVDGIMYELTEEINLDKNIKHTIEIVVDRLILKEDIRQRLNDSVETALSQADGNVTVSIIGENSEELSFSQNYACEEHNVSFGELEPRMFSFNNPLGACPECAGLGEKNELSPAKIIPDMNLSLRQGAIVVNGFKTLDEETYSGPLFEAAGKVAGFDFDKPLKDYSAEALHALLYGTGGIIYDVVRTFETTTRRQQIPFEGVIKMIKSRMQMWGGNDYYAEFTETTPCEVCKGKRLKPEVLSVTIGDKDIDDFCHLSISEALRFVNNLKFEGSEVKIAGEILKEVKSRLGFLENVGLDYLDLARKAGTLSGGEAQRIRLATQIGSSLMGVLYILDEPSIGLHQRDNGKLIKTLKSLRDLGNSLIVVEHDEETMNESDYIIDIGPGAGIHGGNVIACGTPEEIKKHETSITGLYLSGRRKIEVPSVRRKGTGKFIKVVGASEHNLKNIDVKFPLGVFTCVTGVSGSGKSSLVNSILYQVLAKKLNGAYTYPGKHKNVEGLEELDKVICIDQSPIGRTPRSNPATYTGLFSDIRDLFAQTPDAKMRGYKSGRFSFNVKGGRCEACEGDGVKCIEMHFLPDVYVTCDICKGKRYNRDTLECKYKGKNISDVLEMSVEEGRAFFSELPKLKKKLDTLYDVGLGYIKIGQSSTTLSGGEAQRVKLATELAKKATGRTVYILDEPTTGLDPFVTAELYSLIGHLNKDCGVTIVTVTHDIKNSVPYANKILSMEHDGDFFGTTGEYMKTPAAKLIFGGEHNV